MSILPALSRRSLLASASSTIISKSSLLPALSSSRLLLPSPSQLRHTSTTTTTTATTTASPSQPPPPPPPTSPSSTSPPQPSQDLQTLTRLHKSLLHQPPYYTTIHIHNTPYLVTLGDRITLPSLLYPPKNPLISNPLNKPLQPGDIIRLTHASTLGSREYTIKGTPYIDPRLFECKAVVVEITSEPMRIKEKTKRRQRRVKKVKSKHRYTVLRICELGVNEWPEELGGEVTATAPAAI
ncbi:hypothetical protein TWF569_011906 [Orbilia oligospora]|uniref:Large ribosomal subunit protein bL21m n=1 Tax=Orbilia oligospora TaxID=2813651 RepID=A0A7C8NCS4_ORBOL|nr:hypothetical protein TWF103_000696 [Orbilia oligospora]KAF3097417.1 hypothetical protein TWF102_006395 [Orbilia oligospora]KAF3110261.1 hypothetical protein TWF706_000980 [Orbilia oligospora]KAF3126895.1 hypothetical protein TWF569_011906 [Orbilia oligospora]KAF3151033.1 hypothetical protein TWF594_008248 [Orbilia oligospora]